MPAKVSIVRCTSYDATELKAAVVRALEPLGGIGAFVWPGQRVLLKPNLIHTRNALNGSCTHPAVVRAMAESVLEAGGKPVVGDSPGYMSAATVARKSGLLEAIEPLGVPLVEFEDDVPVPRAEEDVFRDLHIARRVAEAEVVINLAKFKTHGMMLLTMAVKNMFGAVVGPKKAQWHLAAGRDRMAFARMLLEVYLAARPALSVLDGVVAMEGEGPTSGRPRSMNAILASTDGIALDTVAAAMVHVKPDDVPILCAARERGVGETDLAQIDLCGARVAEFAVKDFLLPESAAAIEYGPSLLRGLIKDSLTAKPSIDERLCKECGVCHDVCPGGCIAHSEDGVSIDHRDCIRCFCCQEMCPHGAVSAHRGWLLRVLARLSGVRS